MATIMAKRSPKGETLGSAPMKSEIVKDQDGEIDGRHVAAQDILAAMNEKSPEKLMQALANFMDLNGMKSDSDDSEEFESEDKE